MEGLVLTRKNKDVFDIVKMMGGSRGSSK